jgi:hypothetical protein
MIPFIQVIMARQYGIGAPVFERPSEIRMRAMDEADEYGGW